MTPHKASCLALPPAVPTPLLSQAPVLSDARQICHPHAAGIDLGEAEHWVAVPPGCDPQPVRRFGTFTADLDALADWLIDGGVTTGAMESTGVSWMPLFERWEARGVQGLLSDPRQANRVPGRPQTDRLDGTWRQRWHTYGLLAGALRPAAHVCVRRRYRRHRPMLLTYAAHHMQPMHKALEQRNLTLTPVVSELPGVTGMAILTAILAGERDPQHLAKRRNPHCHHPEDDIAKAWQGPWRAEHLFAWRQAVELYAFSHQQSAQGAQQITAQLETLRDTSAGQPLPPQPRRHKQTNDPRFDARTPLSRMAGVDLTTIAPRVTVALRLAARTLHHSQSALGAFLRRMKVRLGTPKAITATAHKLAPLVSSLLRHGSAYVQQGLDAYAAPYRERKVTTMAKQAKALGYTLVPLAAQG